MSMYPMVYIYLPKISSRGHNFTTLLYFSRISQQHVQSTCSTTLCPQTTVQLHQMSFSSMHMTQKRVHTPLPHQYLISSFRLILCQVILVSLLFFAFHYLDLYLPACLPAPACKLNKSPDKTLTSSCWGAIIQFGFSEISKTIKNNNFLSSLGHHP